MTRHRPAEENNHSQTVVRPSHSRSKRRIALASYTALAALALTGLCGFTLRPGARSAGPTREPQVLSRQVVTESFGLGDGVSHSRPDAKAFDFELISPVRTLAILHYQAREVSSGEVRVTCNGVDVGAVPADTFDSSDRELELVLPSSILKRGESNQIIFDNTRNPPGQETWRIWNLRIEPVELPELPIEQLQQEAMASFERGVRNMELKEVEARNRYQAWKEFRNAWLMLEAHPEPRPSLYEQTRSRMRGAQRELDATCARLMLEVETRYHQKNHPAARATLDRVKAFFPNEKDQLCPLMAARKRFDYDL
jgi:hypothetical protein